MSTKVRILRPDRRQVHLVSSDIEGLLPPDHLARDVWNFVENQDLHALYARIRSLEGAPGAPATDPAVLLALWLMATLDGVGSARELERLCSRDLAYKWICGGLGMNHTTLAQFRTGNGDFLNGLLINSATALVVAGVASFDSVAIDGRRIRANAGAASYRRREALEGIRDDVAAHLDALKKELDTDNGASLRRRDAARKRAAEDRLERVKSALDAMPAAEATKARNAKKKGRKGNGTQDENGHQSEANEEPPSEPESPPGDEGSQESVVPTPADDASEPPKDTTTASSAQVPSDEPSPSLAARVSTTDPEATRMKMADGGFRPAFNCQTLADADSTAIIGVSVEVTGSDAGLLQPAIERVEETYGGVVKNVLADGGYVSFKQIDALEGGTAGRKIYMPPPRPRGKGSSATKRYERRPGDSQKVGDWRERLGSPEAQEIYKKRAASIELVHAGYANRGLNQFRTRGVKRVRCELLLFAIAHNISLLRRLVK